MSEPEEMDMPCPCPACGEWFDLQDGNPSAEKDGWVYCPNCVNGPWEDRNKSRAHRKKTKGGV